MEAEFDVAKTYIAKLYGDEKTKLTTTKLFFEHCEVLKAGVVNLYSLIYPLANFKSKIYPKIIFIFSLLQMPIVICKSVSFLLTKFTLKAVQIYPQGVNLAQVENL